MKKITFKLIREDLQEFIYIKPVDENGNFIGQEQPLSYDDFEKMNAKRIGKNLYEYELSDQEVQQVEQQRERIDWLMKNGRSVYLLMAINRTMPETAENAFILSGILRDYEAKFSLSFWQMIEDTKVLKEVLQMQINTLDTDTKPA